MNRFGLHYIKFNSENQLPISAGGALEGSCLFVSTGIGTSIIPIRFRVPPEVSILEMR